MPSFIKNLSEEARAYWYRILLALSAVLAFYGVLSDGGTAVLIPLAIAALGGNGLATANTRTRERFDPADDLRGP